MRRPAAGRCVHCLQQSDDLTWNHVIPTSWYPDSTPADLEKWKIPSCIKCNARYGVIENEILLRLGLCLSPRDIRAAGIAAKALRSIKPEFAKSDKDRRAREAKRRQIRAELFEVTEDHEGFFPGFGKRDMPSSRIAVPISEEILLAFGEKLARGLTYLETGRVIPGSYHIQVNFVHDHDVGDVENLIRRNAKRTFRGPGILVERANVTDDVLSAICRVTVWGRFKSYVSVYCDDRVERPSNSMAT